MIFGVWAGLVLAADPAPDAVQAERKKLMGTWVLVEGPGHIDAKDPKNVRKPGSKDRHDLRLTFGEERVVIYSAAEPKTVTEPYKLDPTKSPKELDIGRGKSVKEFIYKWEGDKLIIAFPFPELVAGGTFAERQRHIRRPRDFKETKETAAPIIWVLKRVKR